MELAGSPLISLCLNATKLKEHYTWEHQCTLIGTATVEKIKTADTMYLN
jgi:hypothetical protein